MAEGIRAAFWPARLQLLGPGPVTGILPGRRFLLDGGHNPDAAQALAKYLGETGNGPVDAVMGMLEEARAASSHDLAPQLASFTAIPIAGSDHVPVETLAGLAAEAGVANATHATDLFTALEALEGGDGTVLIAGSLYLAGKVLAANRDYPD